MYYEGIVISRSSLLRVGNGSAVTFVMDDGNTQGQYTTPTSKNDAIAYTYAMCYINDVEPSDVDAINNNWENFSCR